MPETPVGSTTETVKTTHRVGDTDVKRESVVSTQHVDEKEFALAKVNQVVWLVIHLVGIVIALRFAFLLFNANLQGFSLAIYNMSVPLVRLFEGIFPAPTAGGSYFDTAALLALVIWYLFGYIATYIISIFSNRAPQVEA